ncbi:MAG: hypoxanthine phosphoribosyltransferase [Deltaproteobacteria bacterium]|nr:hypoxanthine phosphoribosyltransferase [Deltaproteobacteria bacterium]
MKNNLNLFLESSEIARIVKTLGEQITKDHANKHPLLIGVLKGSFIFLSDLVREINVDLDVDFITVRSYTDGSSPKGEVVLSGRSNLSLKGRDVIVVEDILDRGLTSRLVIEYLKEDAPASIKVATLLAREGGEAVERADYLGTQVGPGFIVGYGMDFDERYRNLPELYIIDEDKKE